MNKFEDTTINAHGSNTRRCGSDMCYTSLQLRHSPGVTTEVAGERGETISVSGNHLQIECRDENSHDYCGVSSTQTGPSDIASRIYVHNDLIEDQHAESYRDNSGYIDAAYSLTQTSDIAGSNVHVYNDLMTDQEHRDKNLCEEDKYCEVNQTGDVSKSGVHVYNDLEKDQELCEESHRENNDASSTGVMLSSNVHVCNELAKHQEEFRAQSQRDNSGYSDLHATSEVEIIVVGADAEDPSASESKAAAFADGYAELTDEASNMYNEIADPETAANNPTSDTNYEIIGDPYIDIDMVDKGHGRVLQYNVSIDIICKQFIV
jgi:hypothetical protein